MRSCMAQSRLPDQIIVVDDGSTDDTAEVCKRYKQEFGDRFIYHRQENAGVSAARNQGIRLATSDYLVFLDADDELLPKALETYSEAL
ncbi:MAG: glycosyltransferase family A protein, partial [Gammaproteobacteria bacterium]|nr:glycosyltransferase family A protein [Gammaproteobacteria bacterium]